MMPRYLLATLALAAVTGMGFAQTLPISQEDTAVKGPMKAIAPVSPADVNFLTTAAEADMAEIEVSKLVMSRTRNRNIKNACHMMIKDHTGNLHEVQRSAGRLQVDLPTTMNDDHKALKSRLQGESGPTLIKDFIQAQLNDHAKAIALFKAEANSTSSPVEITGYANRTLPTLRDHMKSWIDMADTYKIAIPAWDDGSGPKGAGGVS